MERLVRFVKDNFLAGRSFWNVTDLNLSALDWCDEQNTTFHRGLGIPQDIHRERCGSVVTKLNDSPELLLYLCPERRISFDGFVNYEGRRLQSPTPMAARRSVLCETAPAFISTPQIWPACSLPMK